MSRRARTNEAPPRGHPDEAPPGGISIALLPKLLIPFAWSSTEPQRSRCSAGGGRRRSEMPSPARDKRETRNQVEPPALFAHFEPTGERDWRGQSSGLHTIWKGSFIFAQRGQVSRDAYGGVAEGSGRAGGRLHAAKEEDHASG